MTDPPVRLEPMTQRQYATYRVTAEGGYAEQIVASGALDEQSAREKALADFTRLLPEGLSSPNQHLLAIYPADGAADLDPNESIGVLWLAVEDRADGRHVFGYDFEIRADLRRHGYGRSAMVAGEALCRGLGAQTIGLNVFGHNLAAQALYERMGYEVTSIQMRKRL